MKRFLYILTFLFLSFTFNSMPPPGWYQQTLPVNDLINDIFFLDSLNGWIVTDGDNNPPDTGYIIHTTNGGENWNIQLSMAQELRVIQFLDMNTGYTAGGTGSGTDRIYKTTNSGENWIQLNIIGLESIDDMYFISKDTGWVCDEDPLFGGLYKTTNGGNSWVQQLNESYRPLRLFFINKDKGWVGADDPNRSLYRTTNGGTNWNLIYAIGAPIRDVFFITIDIGWITRGTNDKNGILKTTNGGYNWVVQTDTDTLGSGPTQLFFINPNTGYIATGGSKVIKTTNGGETWGKQDGPAGWYSTIYFSDSLKGWAGGGGLGLFKLIATKDGGGPIMNVIQKSNTILKDFILYQNYPNPFNPNTTIKFNIKITSDVSLKVYDLSGKLIDGIFYKNVHPGEYEYEFDGTELTSGVYFYRLSADGNVVDTKKMVLVK